MDVVRTNADFRLLWLAQTVSLIGSQITFLAIPIVAAVTLHASPLEMSVLVATEALPALFFGLLVGTLVDRSPKRPALISADLVRAGVLMLIPIAWLAGYLSLPLLLAIAFINGLAALIFDSANQALLPQLLDGEKLIAGNSALEVSRSAGELIGPTIAGGLIQLLKAPVALAVDAWSYLASAALLLRISHREARHLNPAGESVVRGMREGLATIIQSRSIRTLAFCIAAFGITNAMTEAIVLLYLIREVGMTPSLLGVVFGAGSIGFLIGAILPERIVTRIGIGPALAGSLLLIGCGDLLIPFATHSMVVAAILVGFGQFLFGIGLTLYNVTQTTLRQSLVPGRLAGRTASTLRAMGWGLAPAGALLGGLLAEFFGMRQTLVVAALLEGAIALGIWRSHLWQVRSIPAPLAA